MQTKKNLEEKNPVGRPSLFPKGTKMKELRRNVPISHYEVLGNQLDALINVVKVEIDKKSVK